jgi:hypothetical protein
MSKISSATSVRNNNRGNNANASVGAVSPLSDDDFVMMCLFRDGGLDEAILSLYYLPPQFKLRVLIDAATAKLPFTGHDAVKNRISLETESGTSLEVSPFSIANAVVYSEATPVKSESAAPRVVISKAAHTITKSTDGNTFTIIEDSPEALASVMLSIAKATA